MHSYSHNFCILFWVYYLFSYFKTLKTHKISFFLLFRSFIMWDLFSFLLVEIFSLLNKDFYFTFGLNINYEPNAKIDISMINFLINIQIWSQRYFKLIFFNSSLITMIFLFQGLTSKTFLSLKSRSCFIINKTIMQRL